MPGHFCALSQAPGAREAAVARGGSAGLLQEGAREGPGEGGPHCPCCPFVTLLPGFVLDCLQDVPGHLLEASSAQEPCPKGSRDQTARSYAGYAGWLCALDHLHVFPCCTSGHTTQARVACSRRYSSGRLLCSPHITSDILD